MNNFITNLILLAFILALVFAFWFLWLEIVRQQRRRPKKLKIGVSPAKKQTAEAAPYDSPTKRYLIQMLHGDRQAVERLIESARARQPGKPECWYAEKVLHDLERDRR